jgi:hypothetical protein
VLFEKGKSVGHYSAGAATLGLQTGVQSYACALFFMTDADLAHLKKVAWSLGVGPTLP